MNASPLFSAIDRRSLLAAASMTFGLAHNAAAQTVASETHDPNEPGFNPLNPHHNFEVFARLRGDVSGKESVGWYKGRLFGVIGDEDVLRPLLDLEGFGVNRLERQTDGSYRNFQRECGFYKDLRSGDILERWTNPYTGEVCTIGHINNDPVNSRYAPTYRMNFGDSGDAATFPFLLPWTFIGDEAMASFDVNTRWRNTLDPATWPRESTGEWIRVSEFLQFYLPVRELNSWRRRPFIRARGGWQRLGPWLPWMMMGGKPGHLLYRSVTKKLSGLHELPADIKDYAVKHYPKYLEAPATWVEPNLTSFETYKRNNRPSTQPAPRDPAWKPPR
jgi:hypothetical protein